MAKITVETIGNLQNETSAREAINANFAAVAAQIELLVSRDGESPNSMQDLLDMNNYTIINLPAPTTATEPARHGDIQTYVDDAEASKIAAEAAEAGAVAAKEAFLARFAGAFASAPSTDGNGDALTEGDLYFNTSTDTLNMYTVSEVFADNEEVYSGTDQVLLSGWIPLSVAFVRSNADVSADEIVDGQILEWNAGQSAFLPVNHSALTTSYDNTTSNLAAETVKDALDEITAGTNFNVYDISFYFSDTLLDGETLFINYMPRACTIPSDTTGFYAKSEGAAASETVLTLKKNDVQFGTVTFAAAGTTGTWSIPGDTVFAAGDKFSIAAPTPADTGLSDVSITLIASR